MLKKFKRLFVFLTVAALIIVPFGTTAMAQTELGDPGAAQMTFDTLVCRPLGNLALIAGTAVFVVSLPFSLIGHNVPDAYGKLVKEPFYFAWKRPLGDLESF